MRHLVWFLLYAYAMMHGQTHIKYMEWLGTFVTPVGKRVSGNSVHPGKFASQCRSRCGLHIAWSITGVVRPYLEGKKLTCTPTHASCSTWRLNLLIQCPTSRKEADSISAVVDSSLEQNDYQGYLLGGKDGRYVGLAALRHSCADYLEILEASK
jgi:hypothetical protein